MLVLRLNLGKSILIGKVIRVTLLHIEGGRVKLGFEGPRDISVVREEITNRMVK